MHTAAGRGPTAQSENPRQPQSSSSSMADMLARYSASVQQQQQQQPYAAQPASMYSPYCSANFGEQLDAAEPGLPSPLAGLQLATLSGGCETTSEQIQQQNAAEGIAQALQIDPMTPLRAIWVYWASWKLETDQLGTMEDCRPIGECGTMGEFWDGFSRLLVADMPVNVSLQLLRKGVPPMYDHPENRNGGHFKIRAASMAAACTLWSQLTVAIAREQLPYADQVQGCNVVKKLRSTTLQVWVVNSLSKATVEAVRLYLLTNLPRGDYLRLKFCPHKYLLRTLQTKRAQRRGGYDDDF